MTKRIMIRRLHNDEHGVVAVMLALMLTLVLSIVALVIDLGNARQIRREAQASADSAALAGGEAIESGWDQTTNTIPWSTVVTQVKNYAKANDNIATSAWVNCSDAYKLAYRPDSGNNNSCISATTSAFPTPALASVGNTSLYLRVKLPASSVKSFFSKALGNGSLTVGAYASVKVVFTVTSATTTVEGGPCALCILNPAGLTLDGQNGDVTITNGNVVVNSTASTAASLNPNGHVKITTVGGSIGGPGTCYPSACSNFSGSGYSPGWSVHGPIADPLANVPQCGNGSPGTTNYCTGLPTVNTSASKLNTNLSPGIYTNGMSGTHTLSPGIYVLEGDITLNGNDLIQGDGVMLYFACSNYPTPCTSGQTGAGIKATGNGAMRITGITQAQCTADTTGKLCPYVGMMSFADRNNYATQTWRGNGTNENGQSSGISGTIYAKSGEMDLRGNGFQMASQVVVDRFTMKGNPSTVTIYYDHSKNYSETTAGPTTYSGTPDDNGLS
jgi:Flp pilus assembly protein TadG